MQLRLYVLAIPSVSLLIGSGVALGQTPGTAAVAISRKLQGPVYPCGNTLCPTHDSGQLQITVNGFNATTYFENPEIRRLYYSRTAVWSGSLAQR